MKATIRYSLIALLIALPFQFSACKLLGPCVEGEGEIIEKTIKLEDISELNIAGNTILTISQGTSQNIIIKAQENIIELLSREVKDGEWSAYFTKCIKTKKAVEIFVELPNIEGLGVQGSGSILSKGLLEVNEIEVEIAGSGEISLELKANDVDSEINGSGDVKLRGETSSIEVEINGSGDVSAEELVAKEAEVEINGSGDVRLNVTQSIDIEINGSGDVSYKGNPQQIKSDINGSGALNQLN